LAEPFSLLFQNYVSRQPDEKEDAELPPVRNVESQFFPNSTRKILAEKPDSGAEIYYLNEGTDAESRK